MHTIKMKKIIAITAIAIVLVASLGLVTFAASNSHVWEITQDGEYLELNCDDCSTVVNIDTNHLLCQHSFEVFDDEDGHVTACSYCDYSVKESHTWELFMSEYEHSYACNYCAIVRESEPHAFSIIAWDQYEHTVKCDCGYINTAEHEFVARDAGDGTTVLECFCGYIAEKRCNHDIEFSSFTELAHRGECTRCGARTSGQHNFNNGVCECGYVEMETSQFGLLTDAYPYYNAGEKFYLIEVFIDGKYFEFEIDKLPGIALGSFVEVKLYGNEVEEILCHVDANIIGDEENFKEYISDEVIDYYTPLVDDLSFEDLILKGFAFNEKYVDLEFERISHSFNCTPIIYDIMEEDEGEFIEDYAYLTLLAGGTLYFVCFW